MPDTITHVNIAFPIGIHQTFTYSVPESLTEDIKIGARVVAPLKRREAQGYVVEINPEFDENLRSKLKPIRQVLDDEPLFTEELVNLLRWISTYYLTPLGRVFHTALPSEMKVKKSISYTRICSDESLQDEENLQPLLQFPRGKPVREKQLLEQADLHPADIRDCIRRNYLTRKVEYHPPRGRSVQIVKLEQTVRDHLHQFLQDIDTRATAQKRLLEELASHTDWIPAAQIVRQAETSYSTLRSLEEKSLVTVRKKPIVQDPLQVYGEPLKKEVQFTDTQQQVLGEILQSIRQGIFHPFLLYGVAGSGKTEIYIKCAEEVLHRGQRVIMLVPEIALTPQMARRFRGHFGERVTLWHSNLSTGERAYTWRKITAGDYDVIIGARSAILLPVTDLGLIIIDEEQENSYKQSEPDPRYHARDVALVRARNNNAVVVLGTATPSLESYYNAVNEKYTMLKMPERPYEANPPRINVVDMKEEWEQVQDYPHFLSKSLVDSIQTRLERNEQIILLQNRRGFAPVLQCMDCGWHAECSRCDVSLTYHKIDNKLLCHYCDNEMAPAAQCPECRGTKLEYTGLGTQRAEELLSETFPGARIIRMDADSTIRSGSHRRILDAFEEHKYDILLGTQMIAKGLDFPNVTLVGVINADTGLFFPDFRARERTFQLLAQVSGRSGRAEKPGEVVIQTSASDDPSIKYSTQNEFRAFYNKTLAERNELNYPPFSHLANITVKGPRRDKVEQLTMNIASRLHRRSGKQQILGPAPAPMERVRGNYHWRVTLKSGKADDPAGAQLRHLILQTVLRMDEYPTSGNYRITVDMDPGDML